MHAGSRIADEFAPGFAEDVKKLEIRLVNGIKEELIPLVSLKGIGRVRARRLFNRGYTTPEKLLAGDKAEIVSILGTALTEKIFAEGGKKSRTPSPSVPLEETTEEERKEEKEKKPQATLFDFGG
jgi:Superfamily II helicase